MASNYICRTCTRLLRRQRPFHAPLTHPRTYSAQSAATKPSESIHHRQHEEQPPQPKSPAEEASASEVAQEMGRIARPNRTIAEQIALDVRRRYGSTTETYVAYGGTEELYKECAMQADYTVPQAAEEGVEIPKNKYGEDVGTDLGLQPTFSTWAQITMLHMYLLTTRFRLFPADHVQKWNQHLTDHFFFHAETRMETLHRITARQIRNAYLKDLFVQWRGLTAAYDEGLVRGDAALAGAVWRNVWKAAGNETLGRGEVKREEEVDWVGVAMVVSWMRREVQRLDGMVDEQVTSGQVGWDSPEGEKSQVLMEHRLMSEPFEEDGR
ncbi:hypothetical protein NA57DRAFT_74209 [Rhizodiscina lignyota]|uniref:Ubiquinol-cytochrome c chaperone domain-containing protein n=1 Tax=Rhizodiscina lignyota TaxID=1504668 RepID=A0A9P4ILH2_9PEZI|nr:hypothetical protein NA57DRAFT_74209 [Rhizodiscina lignyota]